MEVGPRDGLQNEPVAVPLEVKARFVRDLWAAGLREVEATSFVSPKVVPQLADSAELMAELGPDASTAWVLVPNQRGLDRALASGAKKVALFTAASGAFTTKNIGMGLEESLALFADLAAEFRDRVPDGTLRAYVSTAIECPYAGRVHPTTLARVVARLVEEVRVDEVSLGETLGVAVPSEVAAAASSVEGVAAQGMVSWHFHDTRGTALANVISMLERGYRSFDSSAGGLGGCPFAPGAGGNLATEDLVYAVERTGFRTGVDLTALARASLPVLQVLGSPVRSRCQKAVLALPGS